MERSFIEKVMSLRNRLHKEPEKVSYDLYSIEKFIADAMMKHDYLELQQIKNILERQFSSEKPTDMVSYSVGKAHSIVELIAILKKPYDIRERLLELKDIDKLILRFIGKRMNATPTDIRNNILELNNNKQYTSNVLSRLRQLQFISAHQAGKYRWYSLTALGNEVVMKMEENEEVQRKLKEVVAKLENLETKKAKVGYKQERGHYHHRSKERVGRISIVDSPDVEDWLQYDIRKMNSFEDHESELVVISEFNQIGGGIDDGSYILQ